jgi:hypothetical protein
MNAITKRWVRTCRRELPGRTLTWNQHHLLRALREFEAFCNTHRPRQGIASARSLRPLPPSITDRGEIARLPRTGMDPAAAAAMIEDLADRALRSEFESVICLAAPEAVQVPRGLLRADGRSIYQRHGGVRYATRAQLAVEERLVAQAEAGAAPGARKTFKIIIPNGSGCLRIRRRLRCRCWPTGSAFL